MSSNGKATIELEVSGMTCQGCARHVTDSLQGVTGVERASVNLEKGRATVKTLAGNEVSLDALIQAVDQAGYSARRRSEDAHCHDDDASSFWSGWKVNVVIGVPSLLFFIFAEWIMGWGMERWFHWAAFAVASIVQAVCGSRFYKGAWKQLLRGQFNMDSLVALGSTTAFVYSAWGLFAGWEEHLYFMEAVGIITFVSTGHWLESITSRKAAGALESLVKLAPETARKLDDDGNERQVPVSELRADDRIVLKPGDRVPVDGIILEGESAIDESMLTGESVPTDKSGGDEVYGGTANQDGRLVVRVTATGESTALAHIIEVVERAQNSHADIQRLGDKVSSVFVPIVIGIAIVSALFWGLAYETAVGIHEVLAAFLWTASVPPLALTAAVITAAAVLIIACPCAMGLATPVAIMAGTNAAAKRGILIRDGNALEKSGTITAVLFDKTGTLTHGRLDVEALHATGEPSQDEVARLAAALASRSNHPLSRTIANHGGSEKSNSGEHGKDGSDRIGGFSDWKEHRGKGIEARQGTAADSPVLRLGSLKWLSDNNAASDPHQQFVDNWTGKGATVLGLASGHQLLGLFALRDSIKENADSVVRALRNAGTKVCLVSGDAISTARAIASQLGIDPGNVFAEVKPEDKSELVRKLQSEGEKVAFVGDGINDAPALEQADLGIAVSKASDIARESADIILMNSDVQAIPEALGLARATLRTIKQNLFWAFFYNAAGIPLAALGFLNPMLCAAAMGASDLVVIGNALRLLRWKR